MAVVLRVDLRAVKVVKEAQVTEAMVMAMREQVMVATPAARVDWVALAAVREVAAAEEAQVAMVEAECEEYCSQSASLRLHGCTTAGQIASPTRQYLRLLPALRTLAAD